MSLEPSYGPGFALLPLKRAALDGQLVGWDNANLAVLVALAAHWSPRGVAWPSQGRLAALAGCSKTTVQTALDNLSSSKWIAVVEGGRGRRYKRLYDETQSCIPVRQSIVFLGLWAGCTPAARKLLILFLALSKPGWNEDISNWEKAAEDSAGFDGVRNVSYYDIRPAHLAQLIGVAERTYREAFGRLEELQLVESHEGCIGLILPNDPGCYLPVATQDPGCPNKPQATPAAKRAATWRQKRKVKPAEPVP